VLATHRRCPSVYAVQMPVMRVPARVDNDDDEFRAFENDFGGP